MTNDLTMLQHSKKARNGLCIGMTNDLSFSYTTDVFTCLKCQNRLENRCGTKRAVVLPCNLMSARLYRFAWTFEQISCSLKTNPAAPSNEKGLFQHHPTTITIVSVCPLNGSSSSSSGSGSGSSSGGSRSSSSGVGVVVVVIIILIIIILLLIILINNKNDDE